MRGPKKNYSRRGCLTDNSVSRGGEEGRGLSGLVTVGLYKEFLGLNFPGEGIPSVLKLQSRSAHAVTKSSELRLTTYFCF